ncbi:hypothetical protein GWA97_12900, partial [Flavobacterium sp. LaA7.5]|nr:hypothetical protein [Flavobacterium salilacus subsp. altitudinum]
MKKFLLKSLYHAMWVAIMATTSISWGQTPVSLPTESPYSEDFNTTPGPSGTTYPEGWIAYDGTVADDVMLSGSTASTINGANHNYDSKIGLLASGSYTAPLYLVLAIDNTSGKTALNISYDVIKIREQTRNNSFNLEISTTSATSGFTPVAGGDYDSGSIAQNTVTPYTNLDISALDDTSGTVWIRWAYNEIGGSGSRDGIALDNVVISWTETVIIPDAPVATAATAVTPVSFTANWDPVAIATGYRLDVSTSPTFGTFQEGGTLVETFESIPTISGDFNGNFTGDSGIEWSVNLGRTNYTGTTGKKIAIRPNTLNNGSIESGVIEGGIASLTFDYNKVSLGTDSGEFTVSILTGEDFSTVTDLGTFTFTPTQASFQNNSINITEDCKIRIDNISTYTYAYLALDNVTITTNTINEPSFVAGYENLFVSGTSQEVTGLSVNTTYYYRVRAEHNEETSVNSNVIEVTTDCNEIAVPVIANPQFCVSATVADLNALDTDINLVWYNEATGGTALEADATVTSGTYYVSSMENGCESDRVMVEVTVSELPGLPQISPIWQFCGSAIIADIDIESENIIWYNQETGGEALIPDTALNFGMNILYAALADGICEGERLKVRAVVNALPTVPELDTQEFCGSAVASELISELDSNTSLNWYTSAEGTALDAATVLTTGTYYASKTVEYAPGGLLAGSLLGFNFDLPASELDGAISSDDTEFAFPVTLTPGPDAVLSPSTNFYGFQIGSNGISLSNEEYVEFTVSPDQYYAYSVHELTVKTPAASTFISQGISHQFAYSINGSDFVLAGSPITTTAGNQTVEFNFIDITELQHIQPGTTVTFRYYASGATDGAITEGTWGFLGQSGLLMTGTLEQPIYSCEGPLTPVDVVINEIPATPVAAAQNFCVEGTVAELEADIENALWYADETGGAPLADDTALATGT